MGIEPFAKWQTSREHRWALQMTTNYTHQLLGLCLPSGIYRKFANNIDFEAIKIKINQCTLKFQKTHIKKRIQWRGKGEEGTPFIYFFEQPSADFKVLEGNLTNL